MSETYCYIPDCFNRGGHKFLKDLEFKQFVLL